MLSIELMKICMEHSQNGIFIARKNEDGQYAFVYANEKLLSISGPSRQATAHEFIHAHIHPEESAAHCDTLLNSIHKQSDGDIRIRLAHHDNKTSHVHFHWHFHYDDKKSVFLIGQLKDVSQEEYTKNVMEKVNYLFREMSKRLEYKNETDQLTKLKNRGHLCTRGEFLLSAAKREKLRIHAVMIRVENFNELNMQGGAAVTDECLIIVADILSRYFCRATDIAIRMEDNHFLVVCVEDDDQKVKERISDFREDVRTTKIRDAAGRAHDISINIGIHSVSPEKTTTLDDMIDQASHLIFSDEPKSKMALSNTIRSLHKLNQ